MLCCDYLFFQQLWLVHFDPRCSFSDFLPRRSTVARLSCCCVFDPGNPCFWNFLFHYPCWCCSGEVRAVEKSTNHSRASCFIRLHMTSRPHRLKKNKNMQSKHRDLHHLWLHRETNEKLSFHSIFTGCCNSNAENNPSGSTWQNPKEA